MVLRNAIALVLFSLTFFISTTVFGAEKQTVVKQLENGTNIDVYEDGRIKPIEANSHLSDNELDVILNEIGYPANYIARQSLERKRYLVSLGGKLVDADVEMTEEYISSDGEVYEVTPFSSQTVREIQIRDLRELGISEDEIFKYNLADSGIRTRSCQIIFEGMCGTDDWTGMLMTLKTGETASSFIYNLILDYSWQGTTNVNFGDAVGMHWGSYGQPVANTEKFTQFFLYPDGTETMSTNYYPNVSSNNGITMDFFLAPVNSNIVAQGGALEQEIYINKRDYSGDDLTLSALYIHPFTPAGGSISIGAGGLSVSWGGNIGSNYSWRANFTPM